MDQLNVKEQQEFQQIVEQKQMKDFMNLYSNLVSRCFEDCVNDFTSNNLTSKETSCIAKCSEKFLKHSERVGQRFQEQKVKDRLTMGSEDA
ncbi:TIM9 [Candida theae]|uniref:Mitochondrial import inner membrane translocase subunit n=1 Tax=Candida theae TaxID=1198502 RepID=A0AAD5BI38_9ASCO|nr:TIM9 [Candida theae]KAI5965046.1 TIM9 [Candida theae]